MAQLSDSILVLNLLTTYLMPNTDHLDLFFQTGRDVASITTAANLKAEFQNVLKQT